MNRRELYEFLRDHPHAVQASTAPDGAPQAALIGIVVSPKLEIFFDALSTSRKYRNLRRDSRVAFVIGWTDEETVQCEGVTDEPSGTELAALKELYFDRFPDGRKREREPNIVYLRARLRWARYSDFRGEQPRIVEFGQAELTAVSNRDRRGSSI